MTMNLALFDFDGTITFKDTFSEFIYFAAEPKRIWAGTLLLAPLAAGYKLGVVAGSTIRTRIASFAFRGIKEDELRRMGSSYAAELLPRFVRREAMERIAWHKANGDVVVVVSAGLEIYLRDWCKDRDLDLISTELQSEEGILTGAYRGGDCSGCEKRRRVLERYDVDRFQTIYAYGDTHEDDEMLSLADKKFFRWQELAGEPPRKKVGSAASR